MIVDVETLRTCIAIVDHLSRKPTSEELAYHWGWKDACTEIGKRLRQLNGEMSKNG